MTSDGFTIVELKNETVPEIVAQIRDSNLRQAVRAKLESDDDGYTCFRCKLCTGSNNV